MPIILIYCMHNQLIKIIGVGSSGSNNMKYNFFAVVYVSFFVALAAMLVRGVVINPGDKTFLILAVVTIPLYVYVAVKGTQEIKRKKRLHSAGGSWE